MGTYEGTKLSYKSSDERPQQQYDPMFKGFVSVFTRHGVTYGVSQDNTITVISMNGVRVS